MAGAFETNGTNKREIDTEQHESQKQLNFFESFKEKFKKTIKILWYYIVALISIFFIFNFTSYFSYKIIFGSNQVAINKWINLNEGDNSKNIKNSIIVKTIDNKYKNTFKKYEYFLWINKNDNKISWYYCVDLDWAIRKIQEISSLKQEIQNISNLKDSRKIFNEGVNKISLDLLSRIYTTCWRSGNVYRIKYNDVYNWNVSTDVLSINMSWWNKNNIYKIYKYLKTEDDTILLKNIKDIINEYYPDLSTKINNEDWTKANNIVKEIYSPTNILLSTNINIILFKNEITDIKTWFDGNDDLWFFSKLSWVSDSLYDLAVYNIKWTFKYVFDSILYTLPVVSFMFLNITSFIITGILTVFIFFLLDMLPMSILALGWYFKLENIVFYIVDFFYVLIYYFIEIMVVVFILSKIIWFMINVV